MSNRVTVPGAPAGFVDTVSHFGSGKVSLSEILDPAIRLAEGGFPVAELAYAIINNILFIRLSLTSSEPDLGIGSNRRICSRRHLRMVKRCFAKVVKHLCQARSSRTQTWQRCSGHSAKKARKGTTKVLSPKRSLRVRLAFLDANLVH